MAPSKQPAKKIVDVAQASDVAANATARPILASSHALLTKDPMMVTTEAAETAPAEKPAPEEAANPIHLAKTISPINPETVPEDTPEADTSKFAGAKATPDNEETEQSELEIATADKKAETADAARQAELEELIEKGTYNVPINAVHRKRSHVLFVVVALVLVLVAVVLFDLLLDTGILKISGVPHTSFIKAR